MDTPEEPEETNERGLSPEEGAAHEDWLTDLAIELRRQHFEL